MNAKQDRSNLTEDDTEVDTDYAPLTGNLTWGVRTRNGDGSIQPSQQEEMFWTALSGVNDNDEL